MRNRPLFVLVPVVAFTVAAFAVGCGDASSSTGIQRGHGAVIPNDPSELPGAPQDPNSNPNPNATTPPPAPTSPGTAAGQLEVALSTATPSTDLGTSLDITVTVT
jgi:hypothetical protein